MRADVGITSCKHAWSENENIVSNEGSINIKPKRYNLNDFLTKMKQKSISSKLEMKMFSIIFCSSFI